MTTIRICVLLASLCTSISAQNIFVVDASGGPGADFTDIPQAVEAAASGDILDVFPGAYTGFTTSKGIHVLGRGTGFSMSRANSVFEPAFGIVSLPRGERFTLRNARLRDNGLFSNIVRLCQGNVVLDGVNGSWTIDRSSNVQLTRCSGQPFEGGHVVELYGSNVAMDDCNYSITQRLGVSSTLRVNFSKLTISRSAISGNGGNPGFGTPAMVCDTSELILTGFGPNSIIAAGPGSLGELVPAIVGTATAIIDPRLSIVGANGANPIDPGIQVIASTIPNLRVTDAPIGGTLAVELNASPGETYLLAVGFPAPPRSVPGILGEFWLDFAQLAGVGVVPGSGQVLSSAQIPNAPAFLGIQISRQAIATSGNDPLRFSNPATYTIRL